MIDKILVSEIVDKYLDTEDNGIYQVETIVHPGNRIVIALSRKEGISIDDCAKLTKFIESQLDREVEDFELEVGSCGITSPFKILRQYLDCIDEEVEVLRKGGLKYKGLLKSATEDNIIIEIEKKVKPEGQKRKITVMESETIPMAEVLQTKRVIKI